MDHHDAKKPIAAKGMAARFCRRLKAYTPIVMVSVMEMTQGMIYKLSCMAVFYSTEYVL